MKITLRGKNIEITEAIEEKVSEKLSKLEEFTKKLNLNGISTTKVLSK